MSLVDHQQHLLRKSNCLNNKPSGQRRTVAFAFGRYSLLLNCLGSCKPCEFVSIVVSDAAAREAPTSHVQSSRFNWQCFALVIDRILWWIYGLHIIDSIHQHLLSDAIINGLHPNVGNTPASQRCGCAMRCACGHLIIVTQLCVHALLANNHHVEW